MALDEKIENAIIGFLGEFEFEAIPWRVPFEEQYTEGLDLSEFFKKYYEGLVSPGQIKLFKKVGPFDIIAMKDKKIYFFLVKKPKNNNVSFASEKERDNFLEAKELEATVLLMTNMYPKKLFKVYEVTEKAIEGLNIKLNKADLLNLELI